MILIDNINYLRKNHCEIREMLISLESSIIDEPLDILETKNGLNTLQVLKEGRLQLIHSKYDPLKEAERFIEQFAVEVQQYQHVLFYGIGLGYHIEAFLRRYPHLSFTLYEPNSSVFYKYVSCKNLKDLPLSRLKNIHVEKNNDDMKQFLQQFSKDINGKVMLVSLPSYEQIFAEQYKAFLLAFKEIIIETKTGFHTNLAFEQRWTINSLMNFPTTMRTPNILHDIDRDKFKEKPVLLVSAGPSLAEEIENIKYIKENGLAYILSVGSAINALIEFGIYPDAACTYDPKQRNQLVFKKMVESKIDSIPLIFGSSVGFETLQNYLGPKVHMITSQDTVATYYLNTDNEEKIQFVNDAPSIAVVVLQLLNKLGCNPIVLVGQNLAYRDNRKFSKGIEYSHIPSVISDEQLKNALKVESVDGKEVLTDHSYNRMRSQMEQYIKSFKNVNVINTTKKGAKIQGTTYLTLDQVIREELSSRVVDHEWYKYDKKTYSEEIIKQKQIEMDKQLVAFQLSTERLTKLLLKMELLVKSRNENDLNRQFHKFDKYFKEFESNRFYKVFIKPMLRVQYEITEKNIRSVRFEKDTILKGQKITSILAKYIYECKNSLKMIESMYEGMKKEIYNN